MAFAVVPFSLALITGAATSDTAKEIRLVCSLKEPGNQAVQSRCRARQTADASRLLLLTEAAAASSPEFVIASSCIELARTKQPAMIDWTQALACYNGHQKAPKRRETRKR